MRAVSREVGLLVVEAIRELGGSVGPEIWAPAQPGGFDRAGLGVEVEGRLALDLVFDEPLHREARFIRIRIGIERRAGIAAVGSAGEVDQLDVGETARQELDDLLQLALQLLGVLWKALFRS